MAQREFLFLVLQVVQLDKTIDYLVGLVESTEYVDLVVVDTHAKLISPTHHSLQRHYLCPG